MRITAALRVGLIATMLVASGHLQSGAQGQAVPKALVVMVEEPDMVQPTGPLPLGLRFVLYDDGQVLVRLPNFRNSNPQFQSGRLSPSEVEGIRRKVADTLSGPEPTLTGDRTWTDQGVTLIDVWDSDHKRYHSAETYGMPCKAEGRDFTRDDAPNRSLTDGRFLEVCDWLSQYRVASPGTWVPDAVTLVLGSATQPPKHVFSRPDTAPSIDLQEEGVYVSQCLPTRVLPVDLLRTLLISNSRLNWDSGLRLRDGKIAKIADWYFDLPGGIPQFDQTGNVRRLLGRDCSTP